MSQMLDPFINRRILVVDDLQSIWDDFRKILGAAPRSARLVAAEQRLFGSPTFRPDSAPYVLTFAARGEEAVQRVEESLRTGQPFAAAFVDMRMPPGMDGADTIARIWKLDPRIEMVICTAYADRSREEILALVGRSEGLLVLKKPFDIIEVQQMADALTWKWTMANLLRRQQDELVRHGAYRHRPFVSGSDVQESPAADGSRHPELAFLGRLARLAGEAGFALCEAVDSGSASHVACTSLVRKARRQWTALAVATGTWSGAAAPTDLGALVRGVTDELREEAVLDSVLGIVIPSGAVDRVVDGALVDLVLHHLIANAMNCRRGGAVYVSLDCADTNAVEIRIADDGPGLPAVVRAWLESAAPTPYACVGGLLVVVRALRLLRATWRAGVRVGGGTEWEIHLPASAGRRVQSSS